MEQLTVLSLNEESTNKNNKENDPIIFDKMKTILAEAREKYKYYKTNSKGLYELDGILSQKEIYDVLEGKKNSGKTFSVCIDGRLFVKYFSRKKIRDYVHVLSPLHRVLRPEMEGTLVPKKTKKEGKKHEEVPDFTKLVFETEESFLAFFEEAIDYMVKFTFPAHRFGCCSKFAECSKKRECVHTHQFYAKGCYYKEVIEKEDRKLT